MTKVSSSFDMFEPADTIHSAHLCEQLSTLLLRSPLQTTTSRVPQIYLSHVKATLPVQQRHLSSLLSHRLFPCPRSRKPKVLKLAKGEINSSPSRPKTYYSTVPAEVSTYSCGCVRIARSVKGFHPFQLYKSLLVHMFHPRARLIFLDRKQTPPY